MKLTDIMVGDLVRSKDKQETIQVKEILNFEVDGIVHQGINGSWECFECLGWYYCDDIEPILLTRDILEANNFKRIIMENYTDSSCFGVFGECFCYDIKGLGIDIRTSYERIGVIGGFSHILVRNEKNYACVENLDYVQVHQLQHALRLCNLNDLADNFKI